MTEPMTEEAPEWVRKDARKTEQPALIVMLDCSQRFADALGAVGRGMEALAKLTGKIDANFGATGGCQHGMQRGMYCTSCFRVIT